MVDATGMCGACMVPVTIDGKMVRKHACVDGPEIDAHIIDWDKFLPRFGQFKRQEASEPRGVQSSLRRSPGCGAARQRTASGRQRETRLTARQAAPHLRALMEAASHAAAAIKLWGAKRVSSCLAPLAPPQPGRPCIR